MDGSKIYDILIESLLVLLLVFTPLAYGAVHPPSIALFEIIAALMAMLWIFKMLSIGKSEFINTPFTYFILIFILYVFFQLFFARSIYPWATKTEFLKLVAYALIFLVTLNTIKTRRQIVRVLSAIIIMGFLMSIFYLMRYFGAPAPRGFINSDHFSAYLGMIIPLSLGFLFAPSLSSDTRPSAKSPRKGTTSDIRPLLFFFALIMSAALFFTMSRGGMFSFIAALLFIALLVSTRRSMKNKGWLILAITVFIVLIVAWLGATPVVERILSFKAEIASRYFGGRLPIWQGTLSIIRDYPIFGTGLGTFNYIFPKYQPLAIINKHYTYAHSDVLELLSETGIIGFSLVVACGLWSAAYLFRRYRQRHDPWVVGMSLCGFGSLTAIFIYSFTDFNLHIPANAVVLAVILALFVSILKADNHSPVVAHGRVRSLPVRERIIGYPAAVLAAGLLVVYIVTVIRPALADHYANIPEKAINLDPTNAEYHYKLARLYGKSGTYDLQLVEYQDAVRLNPTNSQYHQSLAWAYGQLYNLFRSKNILIAAQYKQNTEQEFQAAISLEPNNAYRHRAFAIWFLDCQEQESISRGVKEYKTAIALKPDLAKEFSEKYGK
jgi:O-antigen ligase